MFVVGPFLTFQHVAMDVGNDGVCIGNGYVGIHGQLRLKGNDW